MFHVINVSLEQNNHAWLKIETYFYEAEVSFLVDMCKHFLQSLFVKNENALLLLVKELVFNLFLMNYRSS